MCKSIDDLIADGWQGETNTEVLEGWLKLAARIKSLAEFQQGM